MNTAYIVQRLSGDGLELDVFGDEALAIEWASVIGSSVIIEQVIDRATLDLMKETIQ